MFAGHNMKGSQMDKYKTNNTHEDERETGEAGTHGDSGCRSNDWYCDVQYQTGHTFG